MNNNIVNAITKAIGYTENGGKPNLTNTQSGKTGEMKSIFQFEPGTWKKYSKEVFGQEVPLNNDTETYVVQQKVSNWYNKFKNQGLSDEDAAKRIFSMWNAGEGEPTAYTGKFSNGNPSSGVNSKYGVKFDVPSYVNKGLSYFKQFTGENQNTVNNSPLLQNLQKIITDSQSNQNNSIPQLNNKGLLPPFVNPNNTPTQAS